MPTDRRRHITSLLFAAALVGTTIGRASAQDGGQSELPPIVSRAASDAAPASANSRELVIRVGGGGIYSFESDLKASQGKVEISRLAGDVGVDVPIGDRSTLSIGFTYEYSHYDFDGATGFALGFDSPWDIVYDRAISARFLTKVDDHWSWNAGFEARAAGEEGADFGDSMTYGGFGGATYTFDKSLTLGLALGGASQIEDNFEFIAIPIVRWQISDALLLSTNNSRIVRGLKLSYDLSDSLALALEGGLERRRFRLDDSGPSPDGVGQDRRAPIAIGLDWKPAPKILLSGRVGAYVWSQYRLDNSEGVKLSQNDADPALFVGLEFEIEF